MQQREKPFWFIKFVIPVIFLFVLCLYHIYDNRLIKIVGDEFGYWTAGSWFAGYDWSEVQRVNQYYGYGYGLLLAVILRLTSNQITAYQIALSVNAIMLCGMYCIAVRVIELLDKEEKISNITKVIIALTSVLFNSNLYYTQFTMSETILTFSYWIIIYSFILLLDKFTILRMISFYSFALISISIHLRTVGVLLVCVLTGIVILYKNKETSNKQILLIGTFFVIATIIILMMKNLYQNSYLSDTATSSKNNELVGQVGKLEFIFTKDGIKTLFEGVCGKLFYALNATFLLSAVPIYKVIQCLKGNIVKCKNKEAPIFKDIDLIVIFLLLATLTEVLIDAIYMIHYYDRFDLLTYGRYFEYTLEPLILLGIYVIFSSDKQIGRYVMVLGIINIMLSLYINKLQNYNAAKSHVHMNISAFYKMLKECSYAEDSWLAVGLKSILTLSIVIFFICFITMSKYMKNIGLIGLIFISILWIKDAKYTYEKGILSWTVSFQEAETALANNIVEAGIQDNLVFYNEGNGLKVMPLQFLLKEYTIKVESDMNVIETVGNNYVLSVLGDAEGIGDLEETKYELIDQSQWLRLWKKR